ncbi:MAG: SagB/ThcOx family dehydrogenase [Acidobacteria bacterium]|nr:SagB/ThcOx family dehydrogenase [Acidobacteriota bacterium]
MKRRRERPESAEDGAGAWYVAEGERGQQLLDHGHVEQATELFEDILARLGGAPSYGRAVMLGRLGRCFQMGGRPDVAAQHVRAAIEVVGRLAPSDGVKGLRGTLRSELGDAHRASGQYDEARKAYEAALKIAEELNDLRAQGVDLGRLGALALTEGKLEEALTRHQTARRLFQQLHEPAMEAAAWQQLGRAYHAQNRWAEAEQHYREAARISEERGHMAAAAHTWNNLADLLQNDPGRLVEARQLAERSAAVAQGLDPAAPDNWKSYGILADIADKEAMTAADAESRIALEMQARDYRELQRHAPVIFATLARVGESPSYARAVILGHLGRCLHIGRRPDLAIPCVREAISVTDALPPHAGVTSLRGALHADLGDMLRATGQEADATSAFEAALTIAEALADVRGQAGASQRLSGIGGLGSGVGDRGSEGGSPRDALDFEITLHEDLTTDYVFDTDLLVDGPRERRVSRWTGEPSRPGDDVRPMLPLAARTWMDDAGAVRVGLPLGEPIVERHPGCTSMRRIRRELEVSGHPRILWHLIEGMDGAHTVGEILSGLSAGEQALGARMFAALAATGAIDVSGRPFGRFLHAATKKGVLPAGGLEGDAVLRLATDGNYRAYPDAPRIDVSQSVPGSLRAFHALTRARRSSRDYRGLPLARGDFDALLQTACGVTGTQPWAGREVKLRAYPSSGALYAVDIYPVVFRVEGLEPAVYHYRAIEQVLEVVRPRIDPSSVVGAALPVERDMVAGAVALFCLTGCFPRHERKYGQGGYRMLVAEAGHISQNLILAATALGLSARPFGGVFDDLLNHDLGLDGAEEQFLLAVLVGRTSA